MENVEWTRCRGGVAKAARLGDASLGMAGNLFCFITQRIHKHFVWSFALFLCAPHWSPRSTAVHSAAPGPQTHTPTHPQQSAAVAPQVAAIETPHAFLSRVSVPSINEAWRSALHQSCPNTPHSLFANPIVDDPLPVQIWTPPPVPFTRSPCYMLLMHRPRPPPLPTPDPRRTSHHLCALRIPSRRSACRTIRTSNCSPTNAAMPPQQKFRPNCLEIFHFLSLSRLHHTRFLQNALLLVASRNDQAVSPSSTQQLSAFTSPENLILVPLLRT